MKHELDMSRLTRRKPDIKVTVLKYQWHEVVSGGFMHGKEHMCSDTQHKFPHSRIGTISLTEEGTFSEDADGNRNVATYKAYSARFGYRTDWSGTPYDGYDSSPYRMFGITVTSHSLDDAKRQAELIYNARLVPYLLLDDADKEESMKLDLWVNANNGWRD